MASFGSVVYLCRNTKLTNSPDDFNTRYFTSSSAQLDYFISKSSSALTFYQQMFIQDGKGSVILNVPFMSCNHIDYLVFQNTSYGSRYYYCFVTKVEYVSDEASRIFFEVDLFQTWFWDLTLKPCFVEREIVAVDTLGANLVDEGIETGSYINANRDEYVDTDLYKGEYIAMAVNELPNGQRVIGNVVGRTYEAFYYFICKYSNALFISQEIEAYITANKLSSIISIFAVNGACLPSDCRDAFDDGLAYALLLPSGVSVSFPPFTTFNLSSTFEARVFYPFPKHQTRVSTMFEGYIPKNNKLYCYPYNYLQVEMYNGDKLDLEYERFEVAGDNVVMASFSRFYVNPRTRIFAYNYRGQTYNYDYGIDIPQFPIILWSYDNFQQWFAQNRTSLGLTLLNNTVGLATGIASQGINSMSSVGQNMTGVAGVFMQMQQKQTEGSTTIGSPDNDILYRAMGRDNLVGNNLTITYDYAQTIDDMFSMYGYRIRKIKTPSLHSRTSWNYVQSPCFSASGAIPNEAMQVIKSLFNKGVRLWHTDDIGNYDLSNATI